MATSRPKAKSKTRYFTAEEALEAIVNGIDVLDGNESEVDELGLSSDDEEAMDVDSDDTGEDVHDPEPDSQLQDEQNDDDEHDDTDDEEQERRAYAGRQYQWRKKDFNPIVEDYDKQFSDPPLEPYSPYQYLKKFLTDNILTSMADQTNLYSTQEDGTTICTSVKELEQFIGLYYMMGLVRMPCTRGYWETETRYPPIADVMSQNRFEKLRRNLHFADNHARAHQNELKPDKLWKLRPWLDSVRQQFLLIESEEKQAVDEIMVPFKGRSIVRQYMPAKPHKWGFKLWGRAGSSGIVHDFDVYQGATGNNVRSPYGVAGDVVLKMTEALEKNKSHKIFADNFFTSVPLACKLQEQGHHFVGTVRANRLKHCQLMNDKELKKKGRGATDHRCEDSTGVIAVRWYDNKPVTLMSTYVGIELTDTVRRWDKSKKEHVQVPRPNIVREYNKYMGGIDLHDSLVALYKYPIRSKRWYIYIWYHTVTMMMVNAWLLYRRHCAQLGCSYLRLRKFQASAASGLTSAGKRARGRPSNSAPLPSPAPIKRKRSPVEDIRFDGLDHVPLWAEKRQRCKHCVGSPLSSVQCIKCDVHLCFNRERDCFLAYHKPK